MLIRSKYTTVVETIAQREGAGSQPPTRMYRVPATASRTQCIDYALRYVVRHSTPHYRYDLYRVALGMGLQKASSLMQDEGPLLHVDLGCGPGLFGWVVRDALGMERRVLEMYGYDHCVEMVQLASDIWNELGDGIKCSWHDDPDDLLSAALASGPRYSSSLFTLGHVLAQTHDQSDAIERFADIISQFVSVEGLLVGVDAKSAVNSFRIGWDRLQAALVERNLEVEIKYPMGQRLVASLARGG